MEYIKISRLAANSLKNRQKFSFAAGRVRKIAHFLRFMCQISGFKQNIFRFYVDCVSILDNHIIQFYEYRYCFSEL